LKLLRLILFPVVPIYFIITWLRNWLYDANFKTSVTYNFPVICVGNLSTGGTGKTPMVEYLIRLLKDKKRIATLSRGYKRHTKGFVLANDTTNATYIGDEPFQFYTKFKDNLQVAVDANRRNGIAMLREQTPQPEVIVLDDAYQHRKVKAGYTILLTPYNNLYVKDIVLSTGNLREPRSGAHRADCIVVTKCPTTISDSDKESVRTLLNPKSHQSVFFSSITYSKVVYAAHGTLNLVDLHQFTLVTGIANAKPLVHFLNSKGLQFEHLEYTDHYEFKTKDISDLDTKSCILTTEKDYMRLSAHKRLVSKLYYLPIEITIDDGDAFDEAVLRFVME